MIFYFGEIGETIMNNLAVRNASKPIKVSVTRISQIFENTNPYKPVQSVIKDYVYTEQRRIIA